MITVRMRMRDWLADRCRWVQYSVPRTRPRHPSCWWAYGRDFLITSGKLAIALLSLCILLIKALTPPRGQPPVVLLFLAALLAGLSGMTISFLI